MSTVPPTAPAAIIATMSTGPGRSPAVIARPAATVAPAIIWPSAPMFHKPIEPATATASPDKARGVARSSVREIESVPPSDDSSIRP